MAFVASGVGLSRKAGLRSVCGEPVSQTGRLNYNGRVRMVAAPEVPKQSNPQVPKKRTKTVVITGSSSGVGKHAAKDLSRSGEWNVIMAVRNPEKAKKVAEEYNLDKESYKIMELDLGSLESVRKFANTLKSSSISVDTLVCNAATWHPTDTKPRYTVDGYEEAVAVNYFGHFLLVNLMMKNSTIRPNLQKGQNQSRVVFIGTETHNPDTLPGKIPPQADLGDLQGLEAGFKEPIGMISGGKFEPTKAYKDSKVCISILMKELDRRYGRQNNITFTTLFPGCVAKSGLFREKRGWFRSIFPIFQTYITRQFVSEELAGLRAAQVASESRFARGGAYWRWQGTATDSPVFEKDVSYEALDLEKANRLWNLTAELTGFA
eukprot:CAMPEP_0184754050 /NCGR_PEP_ID=MMETSP0315-20130426/44410_1 /TAXON_ID=101924 /ORGANISM="Rhodosorus marinus, Strain UTEX LB 2760" /LENGTH=376 /DNA_ID=CAMNT_0027233449 /DNA_START=45 /DNA_END=1175 /DNA_ORIENTATION=+